MNPSSRIVTAIGVALAIACASLDAAADLDIRLHEGSEREAAARAQLLRLLDTYDLRPWLFTDQVRIRSGVIPHSHPVLTIGPQSLDDDVRQLATFLHEQIHWHAVARDADTRTAIEKLKQRYPNAPAGGPEGARDLESTYLHLIVCWLEFDAMTRLVGENAARKLLEHNHYYTWVYRTVLADTAAIGELIREHSLNID